MRRLLTLLVMFILLQMEALAALSREMEHQEDKEDDGEVCAAPEVYQVCFLNRLLVKVCDDDVGFSSSMLAAQAGLPRVCAAQCGSFTLNVFGNRCN